MDLNNIPLFAALTERMKWLTQRQKVLSENVANANTPNYRPRDLKPLEFKEMIEGPEEKAVHVNRTNLHHIRVAEISPYEAQRSGNGNALTPTGNGVQIEEEMMKVAETQIQYELTTSLYKKNLGMLKMALGRR
ncbi:flagellar basal body rod protein FlgB [Sneathiella sp.]|uniref:flagellar basal body rod protein FlgB n=1 Tax=Sneathiella sp. TaxID=1964365 RepID=UPI00356644F8